jgi:integrase/recombinase XerD
VSGLGVGSIRSASNSRGSTHGSNSAAGIRLALPRTPNDDDPRGVKALDATQLAALVAATLEGWQRLLVVLLAETGMRISEALGLTWGNVDTSERRVRVSQRLRDAEIGRPKSRRSVQEVPISATVARELTTHRLASPFSSDADFVFATRNGTPRSARDAHRWPKPGMTTAGAPWGAFQSLGHTPASRWLHSGIGIAQVSRLLGYADAAFTLRVYFSVLPDDLPDGDALAAAIWTASRKV